MILCRAPNALLVSGPLRRAPAFSVSGPGARPALSFPCKALSVSGPVSLSMSGSVSGPGTLCVWRCGVGPRRSLCRDPPLSVSGFGGLCQAPALSFSLPATLLMFVLVASALCVAPGSLCVGPIRFRGPAAQIHVFIRMSPIRSSSHPCVTHLVRNHPVHSSSPALIRVPVRGPPPPALICVPPIFYSVGPQHATRPRRGPSPIRVPPIQPGAFSFSTLFG